MKSIFSLQFGGNKYSCLDHQIIHCDGNLKILHVNIWFHFNTSCCVEKVCMLEIVDMAGHLSTKSGVATV